VLGVAILLDRRLQSINDLAINTGEQILVVPYHSSRPSFLHRPPFDAERYIPTQIEEAQETATMAWDHLSINKPHLVYLILGAFTSLFMLCSSFIKERMYIGEATVATIVGVISGPHCANLINPLTWGNTDQITLEFSRIVLVVQCFAVGVELPKYYMEKHWRSVIFLLVPVMTFGWLVTSLVVWWMVPPLDWLESLAVAACVTATDPVLASSVVGKGKFAKRVPKHLRDLLSAESGCNDGMAFPFIYLALYIIHYRASPNKVALNWVVVSVLYECVFGAVYGFTIGYISRHGIKYAENHNLVDRESFLVFYFVLALFCAGSGSLLGMDDLLIGFTAGVGFSNDGWFTQKTEESHVSNVIDLLLNLAYFVYLGTIIPWDQYNAVEMGLTSWRLVVIALFVVLFRRIPIMMALKPFIPDITTWREALFAGHFGPIGVGAIFVAILARADLETGGSEPLETLPGAENEHYVLIQLIWPITTFLVITSIIVHGSSIAVFTLGKHINTLTLTMSYTQANEDGPSWMSRLPRIASQSKSMSKQSTDTDVEMEQIPPGSLPPIGMPGTFLRRQKEEDNPSRQGSRASSLVPRRRKKKWDAGPVSQSAITPQRRTNSQTTSATLSPETSEQPGNEDEEKELGEVQDDPEMHEIMHRDEKDEEQDPHKSEAERHPDRTETYLEGEQLITENEDGGILTVQQSPEAEGDSPQDRIETTDDGGMGYAAQRGHGYRNFRKKLEGFRHRGEAGHEGEEPKKVEKRGPALAYQFGNTVCITLIFSDSRLS
jgi:sodium/hydrogen antiporter